MHVLRRESFGGIMGQRTDYGFHVVNPAAFSLIEALARPSPGGHKPILGAVPGAARFAERLQKDGFLDEQFAFHGEIIDNGNVVTHLSAPIRVWLEVTAKCNLTCRECFNENHQAFKDDISLTAILSILDDLHKSGVLQLTITGGEPLLRKDIWQILDHASLKGFGLRFFTNGTPLNDANVERLSQYPISHLFASLDGLEGQNDVLRGLGSYSRISKGIVKLSKKISNVTLSVTLHKHSIRGIDDLFAFASANGIRSLLIRPLLQYTNTENPLTIERGQLPAILERLEQASSKYKVEYQLNKLPFFQNAKSVYLYDKPKDIHFSHFTQHNTFGCVGGNTVVGIKADGTIMACGFVPIEYVKAGNSLLEKSFINLWNNSENVKVLRDIAPNETCKRCSLLSVCGGGCRANAMTHSKSLSAIDPYCFWTDSSLAKLDSSRAAASDALALAGNDLFISDRTIVTKCGSGSLL